MVIYKFQIPLEEYFKVEIPLDATFLSAQLQNGSMQMWWLCPPNIKSTKCFRLFGTGTSFDLHDLTYLASIQMDGFVWHLFEEKI